MHIASLIGSIAALMNTIVGVPNLSAQQAADDVQILRSALAYVRQSLPEGNVRFESRIPSTGGAKRQWEALPRSSAEVDALVHVLGGEPGTLEATRVCERQDPSTCKLVGANSVIAASRPSVSGETAEVLLKLWFTTPSTRQPVASRDVLVTLKRDAAKWSVVGERVLRTT
jgi:hypothetical protein